MTNSNDDFVSLSIAQRIDSVCDKFEAAWRSGHRPDLGEYIQAESKAERIALLKELIPLDVEFRREMGELPVVSDYADRFSDLDTNWLVSIVAAAATNGSIEPTIGHRGIAQRKRLATIQYFGDYELLEEIARGGMGVVYKARQISLDRIVAIKQVLSGQFAAQLEIDRFVQEAKTAALLDHPNIVPLYEVGIHQGRHYLSMGFVDGKSLERQLTDDLLEPTEAARILAIVAEAIQYAHDKGVIHRDLKPSNILLEHGGRPRITDFGLAKRIDEDSSLTATGQIIGTPSYMPPEQAAGKIDAVGPHSDVYSLGAVLYVLLTGRPPFKAASAVQTLSHVLEREPASPRNLNASVPRDLETIALKCLEKSIPRRYGSAQQVADELHRFLEGKPILARPISRVQRSWRWCRRNPLTASLITLLIMALVGGATLSSWFAWKENQRAIAEGAARIDEKKARENAERQRDIAEGLNDLLTRDILRQADIWNQAETQGSVDPNITVRATLDRAAARIEDRFHGQPEVEAAVRRSLGIAFGALGETAKGIAQLEQAIVVGRRLESPDIYELLGAQYQLGKSYFLAGRQDAAVTTLRSCLDQAKLKIGIESRERIQAQTSLAYILLGRGDEALRLLTELEPIVVRALPLDDPDALHFFNTLGTAQQIAGQMQQALATFTAAHARSKARFGDESPLTLMLLNSRARWYSDNQEPDQALVLFEELEPIVAAQLGDDSPMTMMVRGNLARCSLDIGNPARAVEILSDVVSKMRNDPGLLHPQTRLNMSVLARSLVQVKRSDEACSLFEELLLLSRASQQGPPQVMPPALVWPLANIYVERDNQTQLGELLRNYLNYLSASSVKESALADELDEVGRYLLLAAESTEAENVLRRSLETRRRIDEDGWRMAITKSLLGSSILAGNKWIEAEAILVSSYEDLKKNLGEMPASVRPRFVELLENLVRVNERLQRDEAARQWRARLDEFKP